MPLHLYRHPRQSGVPEASPPLHVPLGEATPPAADWLAPQLVEKNPPATEPQPAPVLFSRPLPLQALRDGLPALREALRHPRQAELRAERLVRIENRQDLDAYTLDGMDVDLSIPLAILARDIQTVHPDDEQTGHLTIE
jgi:hypothetical protein